MKPASSLTILIAFLFLTACAPTRLFYHPNKNLYVDPQKLNMDYEMMRFDSANGKKLMGLYFKTAQKPKGLVIHFHGNYGNVSNHFLGSHFLVDYGFDVLTFDYEGFGDSEGKSNPKRTIEDGLGAVAFAKTLNRNPEGGIVVFGQSLGGAVAIPVMAQSPEVKAAVIESSFPSYRTIARDVCKRSMITWILYPIYPFLLPNRYDPVRYLDKISPRPIFFIHGDRDGIIPVKMSKILYEKAHEPKSIWIVEGGDHIGGRRKEGDKYEARVADFFTAALTASTNKK